MGIVTDWAPYAPYFTEAEFKCKHTGLCYMDEEFMDWLLDLRIAYGKPIRVTSGYRHWSNPVEASKGHREGEHTKGRCIDVGCDGADAYELVALALQMGAVRIGISQRTGKARFVHIGLGAPGLPSPRIWSY